jgi:hypothetical protein
LSRVEGRNPLPRPGQPVHRPAPADVIPPDRHPGPPPPTPFRAVRSSPRHEPAKPIPRGSRQPHAGNAGVTRWWVLGPPGCGQISHLVCRDGGFSGWLAIRNLLAHPPLWGVCWRPYRGPAGSLLLRGTLPGTDHATAHANGGRVARLAAGGQSPSWRVSRMPARSSGSSSSWGVRSSRSGRRPS